MALAVTILSKEASDGKMEITFIFAYTPGVIDS